MNQVSQNLNIGEVPRELHNLLQNANHDQVLPLDGSFMQLLIRKWKAFGPLGIFYLRYVLKDRLFWDRDELEVREATEDLTKFPEVQKDLRYEEYLRAAVSLRLAREGLSPITVQLFEHLYRDWGAGRESLSVFLLKEMIFHSEKWSGNDLLKYIFQFQDRVKNEELQSFIDSHKHLVCLLYETYPVDSVRGWDLLGSKWIEDLADALTPKEIMEFFDALETILSNYAEFSGVQTYTKMVLPSGSIPTDKPSYIGSWIEVDPVEKKTREATVTVFGSIIPFDKIIDNPGKINRLYRGYQTYIYDLVENNKQKNALDLRSKTWIKIAKRVIQELAKRITQQQPSFDTLAVSLGYDSQQLTQEQKNQICYLHQLSQIRLVLLDIISEIEIADDNDVILEPYDIELDEGRA
ncbi:MAG TPA: hypothetical protein DCX59_01795 [Candidatus Pacebacteria bacterium]|nr:hypothetical protein [Candidatus Paceibacterota bacterium]